MGEKMPDREDSLHKIRAEVNELKFRQSATDKVIQDLSENMKDLSKALSKLDKKFTYFIAALIAGISFGDGISEVVLKFLIG